VIIGASSCQTIAANIGISNRRENEFNVEGVEEFEKGDIVKSMKVCKKGREAKRR